MKNIIKTFSLLAIFAIIPGAFAANATRVSLRGQPSTRGSSLSIAGKIRAIASNATYSTATTTQWLSSAECVENYTGCLKDSAVCGEDLEECTNSVLLHAKMPSCLNVLMQCKDADVANLFGGSAKIGDLYNVPASGGKNTAGEIIKYTYPTDTSILGQMIESAAITNRLSASQCVKKYTSCLNKDSVCGEDFELCTSKKEFKKNSLMCESTLARCQSDGKTELFGGLKEADSLWPADKSRLNDMIKAGAQLAATNTLATCNKVADQCILKACTQNPTRCLEGKSNATLVAAVDLLKSEYGDTLDPSVLGSLDKNADDLTKSTKADVKKFIKGTCLEVIGSNKYCYIVHKAVDEGSNKVKSADIANILGNENFKVGEDDVADVFESIYGNRMNDATKKKIQDLADAFDTNAKDACSDVITECAMASCGGGLGSLCYKKVFLNGSLTGRNGAAIATDRSFAGDNNTINGENTRPEIQKSCEAVVNTNKNCLYSYAVLNDEQYSYSYANSGAFGALFPTATEKTDPIGVVGRLNAALATSYNEAAIENMRKQCANTAISCVRSVCGTDFKNCYRNRTDVRMAGAGTYKEGSEAFNKSMNKVGGVLDYNVVTGLCLNTIKNAKSCEEHLKIAAADWRDSDMRDSNSWNDGSNRYKSVREGWLDANKTNAVSDDKKLIGCVGSEEQERLRQECDTYTVGPCDTEDEYKCMYTVPKYVDVGEYALTNAGTALFQEVLADIEREVQATYNAKLINEQNLCLAKNAGGVRGKGENGSTYMWVKLNKSRVPSNYSVKGLKADEFKATGDLYGAFCRVRVTMTSDDKHIQDNLKNTEAFFAVGDTFTCGSWLTQKELNDITKVVRDQALFEAKGFQTGDTIKDKAAMAWSAVGGFLGGGIGGFFGMDALQRNGGSLGGLLSGKGIKQTGENKQNAEKCLGAVKAAKEYYRASIYKTDKDEQQQTFVKAVTAAEEALTFARRANASGLSDIKFQAFGEISPTIAGKAAVYAYDKNTLASIQRVLSQMESKCNAAKSDSDNTRKNAAKACLKDVASLKTRLANLGTPTSESDFVELNSIALSINDAIDACGTDEETSTTTQVQDGYRCILKKTKGPDAGGVLHSQKVSNEADCNCDALGFGEAYDTGCVATSEPVTKTTTGSKAAGICHGIDKIDDISGTSVSVVSEAVDAVEGEKLEDEKTVFASFDENLDKLYKACSKVVEGESDDERKNRRDINLITGAATSAVGTALAVGIAKTVIDIKYENIQDEAVKKWMEEIGSHIQCVIGTEEAGSYGATVAVDYDD